jgi:predicted RNA-binding protein with TRAM domain
MTTPESAAPRQLPVSRLLALLGITVAATAAVVYFAVRSGDSSTESVVSVMDTREVAAQHINTMEVIDAQGRSDIVPELGRRYRVRIDSESREGASCIAKIGRMITFVDNVKPGDVVVVELTRLKKTTAEAEVVQAAERASGGLLVPSASAAETAAPASVVAPATAVPTEPSQVYTGVVVFVGKFGDGLVKLGEQSVYVAGAQKGDRIAFEVVEKRERAWTGRLVAKLANDPAAAPSSVGTAPMAAPRPATPRADLTKAEHVQPGKEYEVTITDKERTQPDKDGMVRIDGLVTIVPGTQPGDRVKVRITERRPTLAKSEVVERLPAAPAAP